MTRDEFLKHIPAGLRSLPWEEMTKERRDNACGDSDTLLAAVGWYRDGTCLGHVIEMIHLKIDEDGLYVDDGWGDSWEFEFDEIDWFVRL